MPIAILTILVGAVLMAGGLQELVNEGIINSRLIPLIGGALGTASSALLVASGIALLRQSPRAVELTRAAAVTALPIAVLIGQPVWGLAGWGVTIATLGWSLFLLFRYRATPRAAVA